MHDEGEPFRVWEDLVKTITGQFESLSLQKGLTQSGAGTQMKRLRVTFDEWVACQGKRASPFGATHTSTRASLCQEKGKGRRRGGEEKEKPTTVHHNFNGHEIRLFLLDPVATEPVCYRDVWPMCFVGFGRVARILHICCLANTMSSQTDFCSPTSTSALDLDDQ